MLFFDQYVGANIFFVCSALLIFIKIAHFAIVENDPWWQRMLLTFVLSGFVGVAIVETVRGVDNWASKHNQSQGTETQKRHGPTIQPSAGSTSPAKGPEPTSAVQLNPAPTAPKKTAAPLDVDGFIQGTGYPIGFRADGIVWYPQYTDLRVNIANPTDIEYQDLDITISFDDGTAVFQYAEITSVPNVYFPRNPDQVIKGDPVITEKDANGNPFTVPNTALPGTEDLRVHADKLASHSTLQFVLATMHMGLTPRIIEEMQRTHKNPDIRTKPTAFHVKGTYTAGAIMRHINTTRSLRQH